MDITSLRSLIQYYCKDLKNLTNNDLIECKWLTKKQIFQQLFHNSYLLSEENNEILDLLDKRNEELAINKTKKTPKEDRIESEKLFRTTFMRIISNGLVKLKWPPSLEAFSDPINLLFNDNTMVLNAIEYIAKVTIPSEFNSYELPHNRLSALYKTDKHNDNIETINSKSKPTTPIKPQQQQQHHKNSLYNNNNNITDDISMNDEYGTSPRDISINNMITNKDPSTTTNNNNNIYDRNDLRLTKSSTDSHNRKQITSTKTATSLKEKKLECNWRAFEILQKQNELLSMRLNELQKSVSKRDDTENKITAIIIELKNTIGEIVDISNIHSDSTNINHNNHSFHNKNINKSSFIITPPPKPTTAVAVGVMMVKDENQEFLNEVLREENEILQNKQKTFGINSFSTNTTSTTNNNNTTNSNNNSRISQGNTKSSLRSNNPITKKATSGTAIELEVNNHSSINNNTTAGASSSSWIIWNKLYSKISNLHDQWIINQKQVRNISEQKQHYTTVTNASSGVYYGGTPSPPMKNNSKQTSSADIGRTYHNSNVHTPSQSLIHQTLGIQPTLAYGPMMSNSSNSNNYSTNETIASIQTSASMYGFDLARIHLLQRDLIQFSEKSFTLMNSILFANQNHNLSNDSNDDNDNINDSMYHQDPIVFPTNERVANKQQVAYELLVSSWDLLIHLSCLAPIASLSTSSPMQSNVTGLNSLIKEINENVYPKVSKSTQQRIQGAIDRTQAEHLAVIRCYQQACNVVTQWIQHATNITPKIQSLGNKYKILIDKSIKELEIHNNAIKQISIAFEEAEKMKLKSNLSNDSIISTLSIKSNNNNNVTLDSLARGVLGSEISTLINTLRIHKDSLYNIYDIIQQLNDRLSIEVKREFDFLNKTSDHTINAIEISNNLLKTFNNNNNNTLNQKSNLSISQQRMNKNINNQNDKQINNKSKIISKPAFNLS